MSKNAHRIKARLLAIFGRYVSGKASVEERQFVDKFYDHIGKEELTPADLSAIGEEIKSGIDARIRKETTVRKIFGTPYFKAAASLLVVGTASFVLWYNMAGETSRNDGPQIVDSKIWPAPTVSDAMLYMLPDSGSIHDPYGTIRGQQALLAADLEQYVPSYSSRRIHNPTKLLFTYTMKDGTRVWLNANAEVELSSGFDKTERVVNAFGEVSFDVKKNYVDGMPRPFIVKTPLQTIEVLGTQFTVNANDADEENVLLTEGKIKLTHNRYGSSIILEPGEQAYLNSEKSGILIAGTNEGYKVTSWRKGLFHFEGESVVEVMDELGQWYGQRINVEETVRDIPITGIVSRYERIEDVLKIIEMTTRLKFEQKGGTVYVTRNN